jgi:thioredoxin-related protein
MNYLTTIIFSILFSLSSFGQNWELDFTAAKEKASTQNRPIILVFQGSDWCAPCIKLEKEIWSSQEFIAYSNEHYILVKADFPKSKKNALDPIQQEKNSKLAETYNKNGYFPFVVVLDKSGKVLGSLGYKKVKPTEFINILNSFIKP